MTVSSSRRACLMQPGKIRLQAGRRSGLGRIFKEATLREAFQPFFLPVPIKVLDSIRDVILELAILVEDQRPARKYPDPAVSRDFLGWDDPENGLQFARIQRQ